MSAVTAKKERGVAPTTPARRRFRAQSYDEPPHLSSILTPVMKKLRLQQIQPLLGEILIALHLSGDTDSDWEDFGELLRCYVDLKYGGA